MRKSDGSKDVYVLLVEDDRDDFYLTQDLLQRIEREHYWVVWAGSFDRAKMELNERVFDVALVDYRIGERTGLDFITEIGPGYPHTPMILLTGLSDPDIDFAAEKAGAADYLVKDSLTEALLDRSIRYARQNVQRRALLDSVLNHAATGMIGLDPAGVPIIWNRKALDALDLASIPSSKLQPAMIASVLGQMLDGSEGPTEVSRGDGRAFELSLSKMKNGGGVAVLHDITMRVQAEQHLRQAVLDAERANKAKSSFLATMSHELRTPLNGILGMARVIEGTELNATQRDGINIIKTSGTSLMNIINDVLDLSKIEAERMELENVEFCVPEIVDEVIRLLAPTALEKGVELVGFVDPAAPNRVTGDPSRIRQIITNLVGNAIKFTAAGSVTVAVEGTQNSDRPQRAMLRFSVTDTGVGIPAVKIANLFAKFSQVDSSTTREYGGTGLGLALCKEMVRLMQGDIRCESVPGLGSTFSFRIPVKEEHSAFTLARRSSLLSAGKKILVATASKGIASVATSYGRALAETVVVVADAEEAHAALAASEFPVAIVDGLLGSRAARDILDLVKPQPGTPRFRFFLEGSPGEGRALDLSDIDILARPFCRQTFDKIMAHLRDEQRTNPDVAPSATSTRSRRPLRVLMAEDNLANQRVAGALLKSAGFGIEMVGNGQLAVARAATGAFDIILMDVHMPVMDGLQATRELRQLEQTRLIPIVGLTAGAMEIDREKCFAAGMNDHLSKPVDWDKLLALLSRVESERYGVVAA